MMRIVMKTACAVAMLATCWGSTIVNAQNVNVSLNLKYADPANPSAGGTWKLIAQQTGSGNGIAGLVAILDNITNANVETDINFTAITALNGMNPVINPDTLAERAPAIKIGTKTDLLYGQDSTEASSVILYNVGRGAGTPGNVAKDSVANNASIISTWDNSALIAEGTFGAIRPTFTSTGSVPNVTAANYWVNPSGHASDTVAAPANAVAPKVRGDSVGADGLLRGDATRDWLVSNGDLQAVLVNFEMGSGFGWDQGNFDGDVDGGAGIVSNPDLQYVLVNFDATATPPMGSGSSFGVGTSVPEPSTCAIFGVLAIGLLVARKKIAA